MLDINEFQDCSPDAIGISAAPNRQVVANLYLLESLVCDLHWTALHIGTITTLLNSYLKSPDSFNLKPWRHLLHDNSAIIKLGLRYGHELDISDSAKQTITEVYDRARDAKKNIGSLIKSHSKDIERQSVITRLHEEWRPLCARCVVALNEVANLAARALSGHFGKDRDTLVVFLLEASRGDSNRVNCWGEIEVPRLEQRRREPRRRLSKPCKLIVSTIELDATIMDVSMHGLGVFCSQTLDLGQTLWVRLEGRQRLEATVIRRSGDHYGLALTRPISSDDRLFELDSH